MAYDQVEYCGSCKHYERCKELAMNGRLYGCKAGKEVKHEERG